MMTNMFETQRIHASKNFHNDRDLRMMVTEQFATLPRNMHVSRQCSLVSSMDLLSSKPAPVNQYSSLHQAVSIHGTLPRKKKGVIPIRSCDMYSHMGTLPHSRSRQPKVPVIHDVIEEYPPQVMKHGFRDEIIMDPAVEYVKFSKDRCIMDGTPEKLKKELEEELKLSSEELRSHAWYHGHIPRQVAESLLQRDGDFLIRDSLSSPGNFVLTCQWKNSPQHFRINKVVIKLNDAYCREQYQLERESFDNIPALVMYYVGNRKPLSLKSGAIVFQPVNRTLPLRCTEEKYRSPPVRQIECHVPEEKTETAKRLSLNIINGLSQEQALTRGNLLRNKDKSGSQPASLDHMPEKRRPLKAHQSESYLPLGSKAQSQSPGMEVNTLPRSPVFRTGSEPALSPTIIRKVPFETQAGEALRGSDSQLCPKPPPKPSKVPSLRLPQSPLIQPSPEVHYCELHPAPLDCRKKLQPSCQIDSYVERLKIEEDKHIPYRKSETNFCILEWNSFQPVIGTLEDQNEEEEEGVLFIKPVFETSSAFQPNSFESKLLPAENKPLDTSALKRVKELFGNNDPKTISKHILKMDCKVARILDVSEEVKGMMGVSSGLELITLPHGHQLRLDLMERHSTMAISLAVDILGCTGNVDERAAALNKIIQLAVELKDSMGDLFAFSAVMKALDMPQITRLEQTWTTLRRQHTHTAIIYEKSLKPFIKALHEGIGVPLSDITVPLLMPLVTLMERQAVIFEGMDLWEKNDQNCEIMVKHLDMARSIAENADSYRMNAQRILEDFKPDEEMQEIFKTEFQMRLLWGSKGAQVNQPERYDKFNQILTALSRKLEPLVKYSDL